MPISLRAATVALSIALAALSAAPAYAQNPEAEALIQSGIEFRRGGNDEAAIVEFRRALELETTPRALAQYGLAAQALGRWLEADDHLRRAIASAADPWIVRNRAALDSAIATVEGRLARVEVRTNAPGAELFVDGERVASLPLAEPLRVVAGTVRLEVRAAGYQTRARSIELEPRGMARETINLPEAEAASSSPEPADPEPAADGPRAEPLEPSDRLAEPLDEAPTSAAATVGWVMAGVGVLAVLGGGVALGLRDTHAADWNDDARCLRGGMTRMANCADDLSAVRSAETFTLVGLAGGGALAAVGLVLVALGGGADTRETTTAALACGPGPGALGASCGAAF